MRNLFLLILCLLALAGRGQETINFKSRSKAIVVTNGDLVSIKADTAYVLSYSSGQVVKQRRLELLRMRSINDSLESILISNTAKLRAPKSLIDSLQKQAVADSISIARSFNHYIDKLTQINNRLEDENSSLQEIQTKQEQLLIEQENEINELQKKAKGVWWNGVKDKVAAFGGGVLVGAIIILLI